MPMHWELPYICSTPATTHGMFVALSCTMFRTTACALLTRTRQNIVYFCFGSVLKLSSQPPSFPLSIKNNVMNTNSLRDIRSQTANPTQRQTSFIPMENFEEPVTWRSNNQIHMFISFAYTSSLTHNDLIMNHKRSVYPICRCVCCHGNNSSP